MSSSSSTTRTRPPLCSPSGSIAPMLARRSAATWGIYREFSAQGETAPCASNRDNMFVRKKRAAPARRSKAAAKAQAKAKAKGGLRLPAALEQRHLDLIGLFLVAFGVYLVFVLFCGWEGGKVGYGVETGLTYLFGDVGARIFTVLMLLIGGMLLTGTSVSLARGRDRPRPAGHLPRCLPRRQRSGPRPSPHPRRLARAARRPAPPRPPAGADRRDEHLPGGRRVRADRRSRSRTTTTSPSTPASSMPQSPTPRRTPSSSEAEEEPKPDLRNYDPEPTRSRVARRGRSRPRRSHPDGQQARRHDVRRDRLPPAARQRPGARQRRQGPRPARPGSRSAASWSRRSATSGSRRRSSASSAARTSPATNCAWRPGSRSRKSPSWRNDLAYALASTDIRILAPIPGKQAVGVEVPNARRRIVRLGDIYAGRPEKTSPLVAWLGKGIDGNAVWTDLAKMPHVLVAGTTGSGKSRLRQRDPLLDPDAGLAERCPPGPGRPEAGRAQPLRERAAPADPGGHLAAPGRQRALQPDRRDGDPLRDHERGPLPQPRRAQPPPRSRRGRRRCRTSSA